MPLPVIRPRRNRKSASIRALVEESSISPGQLIAPLFVIQGDGIRHPITSLPSVYRLSLDCLCDEAEQLMSTGVSAVLLFPYIEKSRRDARGSQALTPDNILYRAVSELKRRFPELCVMVDIALDPYTDHGHDGLVSSDGQILNDETLEILGEMAKLAAQAGADFVAPSDMMDGRVAFLRWQLDRGDHTDVGIISYAVKYASSLYGPFRDALDSAPQFGDKKSYQLNPANGREALLECALDEEEGADMLIIKPALTSLDIIALASKNAKVPVGAYQVSGEYAMIQAAAERGWLDGERVMLESLLCMRRAGAQFIITYAAKQVAKTLMQR